MPTRAAQTTEESQADAPEAAAAGPPGLVLSPSGLGTGPAPAAVEPAGGLTSHTIMGDKTGGVEARHITEFARWLNARRRPGEKEYRVVAGPP